MDRAIQGNADGLCGLYALINFLVLKDEVAGDATTHSASRREAFRYMTDSAQRLGLLTANKLYSGFESPELVEIFNHFASRYSVDYVAVHLLSFCKRLPKVSNDAVLGQIVSEGGSAVVCVERGGHWVLVYGRGDDATFSTIDSAHDAPRTELKRTANIRDGVAIVPTSSAFASHQI